MIWFFALKEPNFLKTKLLLGLKGKLWITIVLSCNFIKLNDFTKFRFRDECPNGKLSRLHLKTLFQQVFPEGKIYILLLSATLTPYSRYRSTDDWISFLHFQAMPLRSPLTYSAYLILMEMMFLISRNSYLLLTLLIEKLVSKAGCWLMLLHRKVKHKFIILDEEKLMWAFRLYDLGNKNLYFF